MNHLSKLALVITLLIAADSVLARELIREFRGSRTTTTAQFEVRAPWILDWRVSGEYPGTMAVEVSLVEAGTGVYQGAVLRTKWRGNGVRLFEQSGTYPFKVISNLADWTLKVEQLTRAEAQEYTAKTSD